MSGVPPRRRRPGRPRKPASVEGTSHLEGDRHRYLELAGQLEILAFTEADDLFYQRETWVWDQLWELAERRGLIAPSGAGTDVAPDTEI